MDNFYLHAKGELWSSKRSCQNSREKSATVRVCYPPLAMPPFYLQRVWKTLRYCLTKSKVQ